MSGSFEAIAWEVSDGVGTLSFNRPEHFNGMTNAMIREFYELLTAVAVDPSVAVIILTGRGKAFCPGADLKHYSSGQKDEPLRAENFLVPVLLHEMPQVTIAAINGACAGAGFGYAMACDLRYAAASARFSVPFSSLGLHPGMATTWLLPEVVGVAAARDLLLTGRMVDAEDMLRLGLLSSVSGDDEFVAGVLHAAHQVASGAPVATRLTKVALAGGGHATYDDALQWEALAQSVTLASDDLLEGLAAVREKRPPRFTGR